VNANKNFGLKKQDNVLSFVIIKTLFLLSANIFNTKSKTTEKHKHKKKIWVEKAQQEISFCSDNLHTWRCLIN
jgi:hypothetical protein